MEGQIKGQTRLRQVSRTAWGETPVVVAPLGLFGGTLGDRERGSGLGRVDDDGVGGDGYSPEGRVHLVDGRSGQSRSDADNQTSLLP